METQTRFDLNAAIAAWQQELAAQPDLTPVVRRELETHLRDTITDLEGRGLNGEESFWLASRRTGRPQQLGEEFAKTDPANAWKDRVFWIVAGLLFVNFWGTLMNQFVSPTQGPFHARLEDLIPGWVAFYLPYWLRNFPGFEVMQYLRVFLHVIPVLLLAIFLANRRLKFGHVALNYIISSRTRFVCTALGTFLFANSFGLPKYGSASITFQLPWVLSLIALAAWLIRSNKTSARATT
jgi:hypothetical protein